MDFGLTDKKALVCASSKGLGKACATALAAEQVKVTLVARTEATLQQAAADILAETGQQVNYVVADVTTDDGQKRALDACPTPDILVNNAGGPPPGDFRDWEREDWMSAVDGNMIAPILLIRHIIDHMITQKFGRIVNITSASVKAPIDILGLSNGARSGLTGFVGGLARQTVQHNVTINNLLPGLFETDRLSGLFQYRGQAAGITAEDARAKMTEAHPARRFGNPAEFGATCAFLCSQQAAFINGQNILLDGGSFPGTL